jgi:hypothetical protein
VIESSILDHVNAGNAVVPESVRDARFHLDTPIVITGAGWGRSQFMESVAIEDMSEIGCRLETLAHSEFSDGNGALHRADGQVVRSKKLPNETFADTKFPRLSFAVCLWSFG